MRRLYDDNLYRFDDPQPSYWEATAGDAKLAAEPLSSDESCDVAIIGGGYTGLAAALRLARDYDLDVRVLEAGHFGWGASGRNGGFCCPGGTGVHGHELLRLCGEEATRDYYRAQVEAVELVRQIISDEGIDCEPSGDAELEVAHTPRAYEGLRKDYELRTRVLGLEAELVPAGEFAERYYDSTEQHGAILSRPTFGLHPLRYCRGLAAAAERHGAALHAHSEVTGWSKSDDGMHRLTTRGGQLRAKRVIFATNGFIPEGLHSTFDARTLPIISAIIVTRPLTAEERAGQNWVTEHPAINSRRVLNYYRLLPDGRFMFGGRGHTRGHQAGERATYDKIAATMHRIFPAWSDVAIEYRWHGLICFTATLRPSIGQLEDDPSVYFGYGYHGNGVNNATWAGSKLAEWVGSGSSPELPAIVRGLGRRYPLPGLRLKYLQLGIAASRLADRFA